MDQLAQRAGAEALAFEAGERASSRDAADFGAHPLEIVLADRLGDVLDRRAEWRAPGKRVALNLGKRRDLVAPEPAVGETEVETVPVDLPAAADDAARRDVEPRRAPSNFDFLAKRQPEPAFPQRIVQHDADVFQLRIEIGFRREIERHAHEVRGFDIDEQRADDRGLGECLRPHAQLDHADRSFGEDDGGRVTQGEVVQLRPTRCEGMGDVAYLVTFAEADRAAEVVLHDAEVIAVVVDVGGQLGAITPADDALLAERGRLPVHFQLQLVRFYQPWRLGEPFAELPEEEEKPVSLGLVVAQRGIHCGVRAPVDRAPRERQGGIAVPVLGGSRRGQQQQKYGTPAHRGEI